MGCFFMGVFQKNVDRHKENGILLVPSGMQKWLYGGEKFGKGVRIIQYCVSGNV